MGEKNVLLIDPDTKETNYFPSGHAKQLLDGGHYQLYDPSQVSDNDTMEKQNIDVMNNTKAMLPGDFGATPTTVSDVASGMPSDDEMQATRSALNGFTQKLTPPPKTMAELLAEATPKVGGGGAGGYSQKDLISSQNAANKNETAAAGELGKANAEAAVPQREIAESQAASMQASQAAAQRAIDAQQAIINEGQARYQKMLDDDRNLKIDPNHWWASRDIGQKLSAGIGVALGSLGAAFTKGPNFAMDIINKAIDQDFEAQRQNIVNKKSNTEAQGNFLQNAIRNGFGIQEAKNMNDMRGLEKASQVLNMLKGTLTSPQAQAQADAVNAQIQQAQVAKKQQMDSLLSNLASQASARVGQGFSNLNMASEIGMRQFMMDHQDLFPNPNQTTFVNGERLSVPVGADAKKAGDQLQAYGDAIRKIDEIMGKSNSSWGIKGTESKRLGTQSADELKVLLEKANNGLSPRLMEQVKAQVPDNAYSVWRDSAVRLKALRDQLLEGARSTLLKSGSAPEMAAKQIQALYPMPEWHSE
jgi:hypothetical protein